jgi:Protein of unknown function (DUF2911)
MTRFSWFAPTIALGVLALCAAPVAAQQASQHASVSQTVYLTDITVEYDRPVARGRALFGELIEWDVIWTPGANRATWIEFSDPVTFEGHELEAGRYGLWTIPHEDAPWEVILVSEWDTHHAYFSFETELLRTPVSPAEAEHMEVLAFYFPEVGPYEATLRLHWGNTVLPLRIEVPHE